MPELPARAYCAGMASSCYVLKAVDVEMLMLPGVLKDDLRYNLPSMHPCQLNHRMTCTIMFWTYMSRHGDSMTG